MLTFPSLDRSYRTSWVLCWFCSYKQRLSSYRYCFRNFWFDAWSLWFVCPFVLTDLQVQQCALGCVLRALLLGSFIQQVLITIVCHWVGCMVALGWGVGSRIYDVNGKSSLRSVRCNTRRQDNSVWLWECRVSASPSTLYAHSRFGEALTWCWWSLYGLCLSSYRSSPVENPEA